jgi:hypothetical protein
VPLRSKTYVGDRPSGTANKLETLAAGRGAFKSARLEAQGLGRVVMQDGLVKPSEVLLLKKS